MRMPMAMLAASTLEVAASPKPRFAIVRGVPETFPQCLTINKPHSPISVNIAKQQHSAYIRILKDLVQEIIHIPADDAYPDCPFVEDAAIVLGSRALITRPGAISRRGEVPPIRATLEKLGLDILEVDLPGTLDGGDVLCTKDIIYVGQSRRTNDYGIKALSSAFPDMMVVPVPVTTGLHLKSVISLVGGETFVCENTKEVSEMLKVIQQTRKQFGTIHVAHEGAANLLRIGEALLYPLAFGKDHEAEYQNYSKNVIAIDISEFHKADGGLTCLSIIIQ